MNNPSVLVLAAGVGSRYGGLKQMDPVGPSGELIIDYSVHDALQAGFRKIVFLIRKELEKDFREVIGDRIAAHADVHYAFQEIGMKPADIPTLSDRTKPWGTTQAVWCARDVLRDPFITINADDFYGPSSYRILYDFLSEKDPSSTEYALAGYVLRNTLSDHGSVARGVCQTDGDGFLQGVKEHTKVSREGENALSEGESEAAVPLSGESLVSMNMWGFQPSIFPHLEESFVSFLRSEGMQPKSEALLPTAVDGMIRSGTARVHVLRSEEKWMGVTYREDKPAMERGIRDRISAKEYPEKLW